MVLLGKSYEELENWQKLVMEKLRETIFTWLTCLMKSYIVKDWVEDKVSTDPKNSFLS